MIGTLDTKQQQLEHGFYEFGTGNTKMLILGTCRAIPYLNYMHRWNEGRNEFTVRFIDAFNWNWDRDENRVDCNAAIDAKEKSMSMRMMLEETDVFIHEHYQNYGMMNTTKAADKNIYQFGLNPDIDFIRKCQLTSFPEFGDYFRDTWRVTRYFWTPNHVSSAFTWYLFLCMNAKFLDLTLTEQFSDGALSEDLFKEPHTQVTQRDIEGYRLTWS